MKLSAYTIAKNCSDLADVTAGIEEVHTYIEKCEKQGKKACDRAYIRLAKLVEKRNKLKLEDSNSNLHPVFQQALKPFML